MSAWTLRFSQCSYVSDSSVQAQPTPHSMNPKFNSGKRLVTPPSRSALQVGYIMAANEPMWLNIQLDTDVYQVVGGAPRPPCTMTAKPRSWAACHTGS